MDRGGAAKIGGMDRQTLRDWVHRFNAESGPRGPIDSWTGVPQSLACRRSNGPSLRRSSRRAGSSKDGVVRWRRIDLKRVIAEEFGVDFHPRAMSESF